MATVDILMCAVCGVQTRTRCSGCGNVAYCSKEHQLEQWNDHKVECKKSRAAAKCAKAPKIESQPSVSSTISDVQKVTTSDFGRQQFRTQEPLYQASMTIPGMNVGSSQSLQQMGIGEKASPDQWRNGLNAAQQHEWITDCYRMRVDDDYKYAGGDQHGLYNSDAVAIGIVEDFLWFCRQAKRNRVISEPWKWKNHLQRSAGFLVYTFEKSDAQAKYGQENVFAVMSGGRSLRATAESVYGVNVYQGSNIADASLRSERARVRKLINKQAGANPGDASFTAIADVLDELGGVGVWENLYRRVAEIKASL